MANPKPKQKKPVQTKPKPKAKKVDAHSLLRPAVIVLLCIGVVCGAALTWISVQGELLQRKVPFIFGGQEQLECIYTLSLDDDAVQEKVQNTRRHGQTRAFTYFCNDTLYVQSANGYGAILFGNPASNDCTLVLTIVDAQEEVIYRSGGVSPGKYITMIRPTLEGADGSYPCRAYVAGYAPSDRGFVCVGMQYSELTVQLGGDI